MKMTTRFLLLILLFAIIVVMEGGVIIFDSLSISRQSTQINEKHIPILNKAHQLKLTVVQVQQWLTDISATRGRDGLNDGFDEAEKNAKQFESILDELKNLDPDNAQRYQAMLPVFRSYYDVGKKMAQSYIDNGPDGGNQMMGQFDEVAEKMSEEVDSFLKGVGEETDKVLAIQQVIVTSTLRSIVIGTLILLLGLVLFYIVMSRALAYLPKIVVELNRVAKGDLTSIIEVDRHDEAGQLLCALRDMNDKLSDIVGTVISTAEEVTIGTSEISRGNADLSVRTEAQASNIEETAASMEEMTSTVKQNADNTGRANQLAIGARDHAEKGGEVVNRAISAMNDITNSSKRISDIIGVIDEIAFQTNLLALNAAVEAARAGEQGRGFAVVAGEVRTLAGRSAEAAKEIKGLIQDSITKVDLGSELVDESGQTLNEIVESVKKVTDIIAEIAASSREQASGIEEINNAITQLDDMTQQNAALVEEAASASEGMNQRANTLSKTMEFFKLGESNHSSIKSAPIRKAATVTRSETPKASTAPRPAPKLQSNSIKRDQQAENSRQQDKSKQQYPDENDSSKTKVPAPVNSAKPIVAKSTLINEDEWEEF